MSTAVVSTNEMPLFVLDGRLRWSDNQDEYIHPPWFSGVVNERPGLGVATAEGWVWLVKYDPGHIQDTVTITKLASL